MTRAQATRPDWTGKTAVIIAGGASLTDREIGLATGVRQDSRGKVAVVNSTAFRFPWWDVAYSGDFLWWKHCGMKHPRFAKLPRMKLWTCDSASADRWLISWVKGTNLEGLGKHSVNMNGNSGAQAVNLAYLFGARRIVLLGFDMKLGPKGEKHHHPDHPSPLVQTQLFDEWIHKFKPLARDLDAAGCQVINCTPGSALPWFPMANLEETLR